MLRHERDAARRRMIAETESHLNSKLPRRPDRGHPGGYRLPKGLPAGSEPKDPARPSWNVVRVFQGLTRWRPTG
jgi:hypothetical protein